LVGAPRFELGTSCAQGRRATRLRYAPTVINSYSTGTCNCCLGDSNSSMCRKPARIRKICLRGGYAQQKIRFLSHLKTSLRISNLNFALEFLERAPAQEAVAQPDSFHKFVNTAWPSNSDVQISKGGAQAHRLPPATRIQGVRCLLDDGGFVEAMDNSYRLLDLTVYERQESWEDAPARQLGNQSGRADAPSLSGRDWRLGIRTTSEPASPDLRRFPFVFRWPYPFDFPFIF
jgi:hypothetical protein